MNASRTTILVTAAEVRSKDASRVRRVLDSFEGNLLERNRNSVKILISEYDDDQREIFLIPEVRKWFHALFDSVPELFYWIDMTENHLLMYALMMFPPVRVEGGTMIRPEDMQTFLIWGYERLNVFCNTQRVDPTPSTQHIGACVMAS